VGSLALFAAAIYYHPLMTVALFGVIITSIGVIKTLRR